jgi:uncharacterized protein (TIGR02266 family)
VAEKVNLNEKRELSVQVERARKSLGTALGQIQDIGSSAGLNLDKISESLALSVRALFNAEKSGLNDNTLINEAMDFLREILESMQEINADTPEMERATSTIAKVLAILFPVFKALPALDSEKRPSESHRRISIVSSKDEADVQDNRRHSERIAIEADIGFQSDSNFYTGFSLDISTGGLFVATYNLPAIGTLVNLNFKLPNGPVLSINGEVKWIREYNEVTPDISPGIGVRFDSLSRSEEEAINNYIKTSTPLFFDE